MDIEAKPGWKTSEFALAVILFGLVIANRPLNLGLENSDLIAMALTVAGYAGARTVAKKK